MSREKKDPQSTRQLMGIEEIRDYCVSTRMGDLVFFIIQPTNISVLPDASVSERIYALLGVLKGQEDVEMLAMNATESFERNQNYYRARIEAEELPAIRKLLEQDSKHLDRIRVLTASSREFYLVIRLRNETEIFPYLARIEKNIKDSGFITRQAGEQDIKRMLAVYFEQNVTAEHYDDHDGERWVMAGEGTV